MLLYVLVCLLVILYYMWCVREVGFLELGVYIDRGVLLVWEWIFSSKGGVDCDVKGKEFFLWF